LGSGVIERRVIIDTSPIVALVSKRDEHHVRCVKTLASLTPPLLTCWPVLTEAVWLLRKEPAARNKLFAAFEDGLFAMLSLDAKALPWIDAFLRRYEDIGADLADAAIVYLAEREEIRTVFTLDRRDFSVYRLKRNRALTLLPDMK
jgi:predicted nucleic acid-binding protein